MGVQYKIYTRVKSVTQEKRHLGSRKTGQKDAEGKDIIEVRMEDLGWFVLFEGSWEKIHLGAQQPDLKKGQRVEILIRGI